MINTEGLSTYDYLHKRLFNFCRLSGHSMENTYQVYKSDLNLVLKKFPEPENVGLLAIQDFAASFKNEHTRKNICTRLLWVFNTVYNRNIKWFELPFPKKKIKVQPVYSFEEITKILGAITNEKAKAAIALMVDCGLRISEPCGILIADCNSKSHSITLRSAKGDNDRVIYPSTYVWELIKRYWKAWKKKATDKYLFDGHHPQDRHYTTSSVLQVIQRACIASGVVYKGSHAIRRFSITWSIENGVPAVVIAKKVGHKTVRTIENHYQIHSPAYMKNINSPLKEARV